MEDTSSENEGSLGPMLSLVANIDGILSGFTVGSEEGPVGDGVWDAIVEAWGELGVIHAN